MWIQGYNYSLVISYLQLWLQNQRVRWHSPSAVRDRVLVTLEYFSRKYTQATTSTCSYIVSDQRICTNFVLLRVLFREWWPVAPKMKIKLNFDKFSQLHEGCGPLKRKGRFCNLKGAIARENALLQIKPIKVVDECREFE